jgi:hypothetical protein
MLTKEAERTGLSLSQTQRAGVTREAMEPVSTLTLDLPAFRTSGNKRTVLKPPARRAR